MHVMTCVTILKTKQGLRPPLTGLIYFKIHVLSFAIEKPVDDISVIRLLERSIKKTREHFM